MAAVARTRATTHSRHPCSMGRCLVRSAPDAPGAASMCGRRSLGRKKGSSCYRGRLVGQGDHCWGQVLLGADGHQSTKPADVAVGGPPPPRLASRRAGVAPITEALVANCCLMMRLWRRADRHSINQASCQTSVHEKVFKLTTAETNTTLASTTWGLTRGVGFTSAQLRFATHDSTHDLDALRK